MEHPLASPCSCTRAISAFEQFPLSTTSAAQSQEPAALHRPLTRWTVGHRAWKRICFEVSHRRLRRRSRSDVDRGTLERIHHCHAMSMEWRRVVAFPIPKSSSYSSSSSLEAELMGVGGTSESRTSRSRRKSRITSRLASFRKQRAERNAGPERVCQRPLASCSPKTAEGLIVELFRSEADDSAMRHMNYRTLALTSSTALALIGILWLYNTFWAEGRVVCSLSKGGQTYKIRQIPIENPGLNDGYIHRCEVWSGSILTTAKAYAADSWKPQSFSITTPVDGKAHVMVDIASGYWPEVIFHLDGAEFGCQGIGFNVSDTTWTVAPPTATHQVAQLLCNWSQKPVPQEQGNF